MEEIVALGAAKIAADGAGVVLVAEGSADHLMLAALGIANVVSNMNNFSQNWWIYFMLGFLQFFTFLSKVSMIQFKKVTKGSDLM